MDTKISIERLRELEKAAFKLQCLEDGGVDNWDYYDVSMEPYYKKVDREEKIESLLNDICEALGTGAYEPSERGAGLAFSQGSEAAALAIMMEKIIDIKD